MLMISRDEERERGRETKSVASGASLDSSDLLGPGFMRAWSGLYFDRSVLSKMNGLPDMIIETTEVAAGCETGLRSASGT